VQPTIHFSLAVPGLPGEWGDTQGTSMIKNVDLKSLKKFQFWLKKKMAALDNFEDFSYRIILRFQVFGSKSCNFKR